MSRDLSPQAAIDEFLSRIRAPRRLLVAISGGSDSTGLLVALKARIDLLGRRDISLHAATVDHRLRPESADEARTVAALCSSFGIVHHTLVWSGEKPESGLSAAAREARYALLVALALRIGADAILTGHTRDDQDETVAMRFARSQRPDNLGLAGMAACVLLHRKIWLLRPLLGCRREEIRAFLGLNGVGWMDDPSNCNPAYERARVRKELAGSSLDNGYDYAASRRQVSRLAAGIIAEALTVRHAVLGHIGIDVRAVPPAALRLVLSSLLRVFGGQRYHAAGETLDRVTDFVMTGAPGRMTAGGALLDQRRIGLYMMRESRDILPQFLPGRATGTWDGRFHVENRGDIPLRIESHNGPVGSDAAFPGTPSGIVKRLGACMPRIVTVSPDNVCFEAEPGTFNIEPAFPAYDDFLPDFDFPIANAIARAFGRTDFLPLFDGNWH